MSEAMNVGEADFTTQVLQSKTPVLVDFWAIWCGPCRMVAPIVDKIAKDFKGRLKVVKLDTDASPSIAGKYEVSSIPTLIVFKDGEPVDRIVGYVPERQVVSTVEKYLAPVAS